MGQSVKMVLESIFYIRSYLSTNNQDQKKKLVAETGRS